MKVICIDDYYLNGNKAKLTLYKTYEVIGVSENSNNFYFDPGYYVRNDSGITRLYTTDMLIPLEEWREKRLKEILK